MNAAVKVIIEKIGNVINWVEFEGVLYTLSADAVVRVNDVDTGLNVHCVRCGSPEAAFDLFAETIVDVVRTAA